MDLSMTYTALRAAFESLKIYFLIYCLCLVIIFFIGKYADRERFIYPVIFLSLTLYNPIFVSPIADKIGLLARIRRIYWLLPVTLLIVYVIVKLFSKMSSRMGRIMLIAVTVLVVISWNNFFENRKTPENIYKISDESIEVAEKLHELDGSGGDIMVAFSDDRLQEIRMYDASVRNVLRRKDLLNWQPDISDSAYVNEVISKGKPNRIMTLFLKYGVVPPEELLKESLIKKDVSYVISDREPIKLKTMEDMGCVLKDETDSFYIFAIPEVID